MTFRRIAALAAFDAAAVLIIVALVSLSAWQVQRRAWKLDLIARIEARVRADPVPAPSEDRWPDISVAADEYRRVSVSGRWLDARAALIKAVTDFGEGYWVLAPFVRDDGSTILINRGFVPADRVTGIPSPTDTFVTGKLRLSEPRGGFLRSNDAEGDRWFSRDVAAIAASRGLSRVAPYFLDAEGPSPRGELPIPGLTVLAFPNNHLVYALTWAALALMALLGAGFVNIEVIRPGSLVRGKSPA